MEMQQQLGGYAAMILHSLWEDACLLLLRNKETASLVGWGAASRMGSSFSYRSDRSLLPFASGGWASCGRIAANGSALAAVISLLTGWEERSLFWPLAFGQARFNLLHMRDVIFVMM